MKVRLLGKNLAGRVVCLPGHTAQRMIDKGMAERYESKQEQAAPKPQEKVLECAAFDAEGIEKAILQPTKKRRTRKKK